MRRAYARFGCVGRISIFSTSEVDQLVRLLVRNEECMNLVLKNNEKLSPEVMQLAQSIGKFIEYWGFKSIHGKIWALLFLSQEPLSAVELSRKLQVSKTLLSFSISELLEYEVIESVGKGAKRTVFFRANPDLTGVILNVLRRRERPMMSEIESAYIRVQESRSMQKGALKIDAQQMVQLGEWIRAGKSALDSLVLQSDSEFGLLQQFILISALFAHASEDEEGSRMENDLSKTNKKVRDKVRSDKK